MSETAARSDLMALKPCPFCGGEPSVADASWVEGAAMIYCAGEECMGPRTTAASLQDATVQWNTRAAAQPDRSKNWTLVDGTMTTGESIIFDGSFIIAKFTRREDAEFILSLLTKSDGKCQDCGKSLSDDTEPHAIDCSERPSDPSPGPDVRRRVLDILNVVAPAVENLARHQGQCDMDGVMVKVSRQALDEVLNAVNEVALVSALTRPLGGNIK